MTKLPLPKASAGESADAEGVHPMGTLNRRSTRRAFIQGKGSEASGYAAWSNHPANVARQSAFTVPGVLTTPGQIEE